jgi:SOS response regulatory protein OraA/RecX
VKNKELYAKALKLLGQKVYSEAELREKLYRYAGNDEVDDVIQECKRRRYLDDKALAEYLVERNLQRGKGFWYIISVLEKRKIREDIIEEIKNSFDFETEYKKAEEVVCRSRKKKKDISSIIFSLKSKGFSYPVLNRIGQKYLKKWKKGEEIEEL